MKVKDLKELIANCDDNGIVLIEDVEGDCLEIVNWGVSKDGDRDCVYLSTRQEFPDAWFQHGKEVHWIAGKAVILNNKEEEGVEIVVSDPDLFGTTDDQFLYLDFKDGIAEGDGVRMTYPKLADLTDDEIKKINEYCGGRIADSGCIVPYDVALLFGKLEVIGLMNDGYHEPHLVHEINKRWVLHKDSFRPILCALYERDIKEITDSDCFQIPEWLKWPEWKDGAALGNWDLYMFRALDDMKCRWDDFADDYLMHIADDQDLETIITFVRCDIAEGTGRDKQFTK